MENPIVTLQKELNEAFGKHAPEVAAHGNDEFLLYLDATREEAFAIANLIKVYREKIGEETIKFLRNMNARYGLEPEKERLIELPGSIDDVEAIPFGERDSTPKKGAGLPFEPSDAWMFPEHFEYGMYSGEGDPEFIDPDIRPTPDLPGEINPTE